MTEIHDATPDWAKLDWANGEIERLHREVSRRDVVLRWIAENMPGTLELCPYKLGELRETSNQDRDPASALAVHLPAIFKDELPAGFEGINIVSGVASNNPIPEPGGLPAASNQERKP